LKSLIEAFRDLEEGRCGGIGRRKELHRQEKKPWEFELKKTQKKKMNWMEDEFSYRFHCFRMDAWNLVCVKISAELSPLPARKVK
jgi:hypothetical protein